MIAGYYLVFWAILHILINTLLWGIAGAVFFQFFFCNKEINFHVKTASLFLIYFMWDSVFFSAVIRHLDLHIGNADLADYLGFSKIPTNISFVQILLSYAQMVIGYKIGEKLLKNINKI